MTTAGVNRGAESDGSGRRVRCRRFASSAEETSIAEGVMLRGRARIQG